MSKAQRTILTFAVAWLIVGAVVRWIDGWEPRFLPPVDQWRDTLQ